MQVTAISSAALPSGLTSPLNTLTATSSAPCQTTNRVSKHNSGCICTVSCLQTCTESSLLIGQTLTSFAAKTSPEAPSPSGTPRASCSMVICAIWPRTGASGQAGLPAKDIQASPLHAANSLGTWHTNLHLSLEGKALLMTSEVKALHPLQKQAWSIV